MSVHVHPYSFPEKQLNHILQRPKSAHRIIPPSTEKPNLQGRRRCLPCRLFLYPCPSIHLYEQRLSKHPLPMRPGSPLHTYSPPSVPGSNTDSYPSFLKDTEPQIYFLSLYSLDQASYSPTHPQLVTILLQTTKSAQPEPKPQIPISWKDGDERARANWRSFRVGKGLLLSSVLLQ